MATIPGSVPLAGFIGPTDDGDNYATQDEKYNRGGWRTVADVTARNAIPSDRRKVGMIVRVLDAGSGVEAFYTLVGGVEDDKWTVQNFGGTGGGDAVDITFDPAVTGLPADNVQEAIDQTYETIADITNPFLFKGGITLAADFPTSADVRNGWTYRILAGVTDNNPAKTNTGQTFLENDEIVWNGTNWTVLGNASAGDSYTNATAMPVTVGGWIAGSTFTSESMQAMWDGLLYPYQYPAFTAFAISGQTTPLEVGDTIAINRTFTWATSNSSNVNANSIDLYDVTGSASIATGLANDGSEATSYPASPIQKTSATTHTFRVDGVNSKSETFSRTYTVTWQWKRYYGESTNAGPLTEAQIEALRINGLASGFAATYTFVGGGYKYLAYPAVLGTATSFKDQSTGLDVPFESSYTVSVTNGFSQTTNYRVHRTTNIMGSGISIIVS